MKKKILALVLGCSITTSIFSGGSSSYILISGCFGLAITTGVFSYLSISDREEEAEQKLVLYMKKNHASLVRDISMAKGPTITEWGANMDLTPLEQARLENRFEGSMEQISLLESLSGDIDVNDAGTFARALARVMVDVIGEDRMLEKIKQADLE